MPEPPGQNRLRRRAWMLLLGHFPAKRKPHRIGKTCQINKAEQNAGSARSHSTLDESPQ